jgi:hypothetical protein
LKLNRINYLQMRINYLIFLIALILLGVCIYLNIQFNAADLAGKRHLGPILINLEFLYVYVYMVLALINKDWLKERYNP